MLAIIEKIWRFACYFYNAKKVWRRPKQNDLLIYDAVRQKALMEFLGSWKPEVLSIRSEQINLRVAFSSLFRGGSIFGNYVDCYIEKVRPRLVVTIVDTDINFYMISKKFPDVKTLFIQNGLRTYDLYFAGELSSSIRSKFFVDYMLVFGECVGTEYKRVVGGEVVPMGAIMNNSVPKVCQPQPGVLAYISQWAQKGFCLESKNYSHEDFYEKPDRVVLEFLVRYAEEKNKQLVIIPRYCENDDLREAETTYFRNLLGSEPEFLEPEGPRSCYQAVDSVEVSVTIDSTLGIESMVRGNKTAVFSIRTIFSGLPAGNFGWPGDFPEEGLFWTNKTDPDCFDRILNYLFEIDEIQWRKDIKSNKISSLMLYDPGNSILKSTLKKVLGPTVQ